MPTFFYYSALEQPGPRISHSSKFLFLSLYTVNELVPQFAQNGQPPSEMLISSIIFMTVEGITGNLILPCSVTGATTINWYREDTLLNLKSVTSSGTLIINVTEGVNTRRRGTPYHCFASYPLTLSDGSIASAGFRSREVNVIHTCKHHNTGRGARKYCIVHRA